MSSSGNSQLSWVVVGLLVAVLAGGGLFIVPSYRCAAQTRATTENLRHKMAGLSGQTEVVEQLADEVTAMRQRMARDLKYIPASPDTAELIKSLSLPVDGVTVIDQTLTFGSAGDAIVGKETATMAKPLTIDMVGRFDSVFATIQAAESMPCLLRVTSVRMEAERENDGVGDPVLTASVGVEAIFGSAENEEGH